MPCIARMILGGEPVVYHVASRSALDGFVLGVRVWIKFVP